MEHPASAIGDGLRLDPGVLPRLSYVGEVPVEFSYHGSALLARLLDEYPQDRLQVVEGVNHSLSSRRLPGVEYVRCEGPLRRLRTTRFAGLAAQMLARGSWMYARCAAAATTAFHPDAILTVAHGTYWLVAARLSRLLRVPLHLIVHDHVPLTVFGGAALRNWIDRRFGAVYRGAASRLCVSPYMERRYSELYGVSGQVLYPARAKDAAVHGAPPDRLGRAAPRLTAVFAGTINTPAYAGAIAALAAALDRVGGRVLLYGPITSDAASRVNLTAHNIELRGLVDSRELIARCREEADFLYVPMSFADEDRVNMELSFPSKLTDYTAMGLPLLVHGPGYCSAVRWASDNPGVAIVVDVQRSGALDQAVEVLLDGTQRMALARAAIAAGHEYFGHARAQALFDSAMRTAG